VRFFGVKGGDFFCFVEKLHCAVQPEGASFFAMIREELVFLFLAVGREAE